MESAPVGITLTGTSTSRFPRRMIAPLPCCFSICAIAASNILIFSSVIIHLERNNVRLLRQQRRPDAGVYYRVLYPAQIHREGQDTIGRIKSKYYFAEGSRSVSGKTISQAGHQERDKSFGV